MTCPSVIKIFVENKTILKIVLYIKYYQLNVSNNISGLKKGQIDSLIIHIVNLTHFFVLILGPTIDSLILISFLYWHLYMTHYSHRSFA